MLWSTANQVLETLRRDRRLYLPGLTRRRGFSSTRVEHLLNYLRDACPPAEAYLEVGTLEGRTLEAAAHGNSALCIGVDPCEKYREVPENLPPNVRFLRKRWQEITTEDVPERVGVLFYDGDHSAVETYHALCGLDHLLADEAVIVIDDWDRPSVRDGTFMSLQDLPHWRLLRECPEYTNGPDHSPPNHFGWYYGVALLGAKR